MDSIRYRFLRPDMQCRIFLVVLCACKPTPHTLAASALYSTAGGFYMAMGAGVIVAEPLTITGSIGVVTAKFNLQELYTRIGFSKEVISRGR